jgi:hypothetical protein
VKACLGKKIPEPCWIPEEPHQGAVDPRHYEGWDGQLTAYEADVKDTPRRHRVEDAVGSDA